MGGKKRSARAPKRGPRRSPPAEAEASLPAMPVPGERALLFAPRGGPRSLIVGDLHIGIEAEFARGGVRLPSATPAMVRRLQRLAVSTRARVLIVAGDVKHSVGAPSEQEVVELPMAFREAAASYDEVVIVPGNHDGLVEQLLPHATRPENLRIAPVGGHLCRGGLLVVHGHAWPDGELARKAKGVAAAHTHAAVALEDAMGRIEKEPCWARLRVNPEKWKDRYGVSGRPELILIPPFNELCTGVPLNVAGGLGPLLRDGFADVGRADVYLLDGIHLGKVRGLDVAAEPGQRARLMRGVHEDL